MNDLFAYDQYLKIILYSLMKLMPASLCNHFTLALCLSKPLLDACELFSPHNL